MHTISIRWEFKKRLDTFQISIGWWCPRKIHLIAVETCLCANLCWYVFPLHLSRAAHLLSRYRPRCPIISITRSPQVQSAPLNQQSFCLAEKQPNCWWVTLSKTAQRVIQSMFTLTVFCCQWWLHWRCLTGLIDWALLLVYFTGVYFCFMEQLIQKNMNVSQCASE